jgi:hypothetical protein
VLTLSTPSYQAVKRVLEALTAAEKAAAAARAASLQQAGQYIRAIDEYRAFWEEYSRGDPNSSSPTHSDS